MMGNKSADPIKKPPRAPAVRPGLLVTGAAYLPRGREDVGIGMRMRCMS